MSLSVLSAQTVGALVTSGDGGSFEAPSVGDFFWPVIGGDSNWALTRPAVVLLISVAILGWFYMTVAGRLSLVPSKRQWVAEQGYDFGGFGGGGLGQRTLGGHSAPIASTPSKEVSAS